MSVLAVVLQVRQASSLPALADAVITGLRNVPGIAGVAVIGFTQAGRPALWIGDDDFDPDGVQAFLDGRGDDPCEHRRRQLAGALLEVPIAGSAQVAGTIRAIATTSAPAASELALLSAVVSIRLAALGIDAPLGDHLEPIHLSARQHEIAWLVARGCTNAEIAKMVGRSAHAVKKQVSRLCVLLDVSNRTELAALAPRWTPKATPSAPTAQHRIYRRVRVS